MLEKRLFDAWGNVLVQDGNGNILNGLTILDRGYTGHEHLQSVGLINMNGRLYDPKLHRFLQPDNYVQDPNDTQNYNRYGYVLNNPLKYTDPSGESWKSWWNNNWKSVVTVVAAVATAVVIVGSMGTATPLVAAMWAGAGAGFVGGTLGTALNGGTLGQSLMAGFTGAFMGAATGYAGAYMSAAIGAVGIVPGALSGAATSTTLGALGNIISGNDWDAGLGMTAAFGAVGGGISGFSAAKDSGRGIWFGTSDKPSASVIAGNINKQTKQAQADYNRSTQSQTQPTNMSSSSSGSQFDEFLPSNGLKPVHGNSLQSQKPTWGYKLFDNDGNFLKNGITNKPIPEMRYSKTYMKTHYMDNTIQFSNRLKAYQWEYQQNLIQRGPLNLNMH